MLLISERDLWLNGNTFNDANLPSIITPRGCDHGNRCSHGDNIEEHKIFIIKTGGCYNDNRFLCVAVTFAVLSR